jgi:hypothetical protein
LTGSSLEKSELELLRGPHIRTYRRLCRHRP